MAKNQLFILFVVLGFLISAQKATAQNFQVSLDGGVGVPQKDFRTQLDNIGGTLAVFGGYQLPGSPLMIGLDLGLMNFGIDRRDEPLSTTIPDLTVRVENSYNLFYSDLVFRLIPPSGPIRPYLDLLAGFNYFYTETSIRDRRNFFEEPVISDTNFDDFAWNYGFGAGTLIQVSRGSRGTGAIYLNLSARYIYGNEAEYLQSGSITIDENSNVFYDVSRSITDLLHIRVGVTVNL
ncbi:MAG: hypothetical protein EA360_12030 [Balneolaceae bacterium]|nr:MAG: hypothetical protein EA360_12030 [Balneolaceae bacterium]